MMSPTVEALYSHFVDLTDISEWNLKFVFHNPLFKLTAMSDRLGILLIFRIENPSLDSHPTFIRGQSGLDFHVALFVLGPISTSELNNFACK
jgi:hypothetical protein